MTLPKTLAFVDLETTGASLNYDRIIDIGILRVEDGRVVKTYNSLLNPNRYLPEEITRLTGISKNEVERAPTFRQIKDELIELFQDCVLVAHNARFDYGFLKKEFKDLKIQFSPKQICTVKLSKSIFPQHRKHNLDSLIERHNLSCENRHRAFDDAKAIWDFYQLVINSTPQDQLLKIIDKLLKQPSVPLNISLSILENLPEGPGVYIFYGENGIPLYIGKSVNIKGRVLSHFSSDHISSSEMKISQTIESIETIVTKGELGALFLESDLIKKLQPLYNRKLRYARGLTLLKYQPNDNLYQTIVFEEGNNLDVSQLDFLINVFKSKKTAKEYLINLAKEFELCDKLLGLEKTSGSCFGYKLGRCKGGCVGKEEASRYNLRFTSAVARTKIKPWPFDKPILIEEKNPLEEERDYFLIDKWCYLGNIKVETEMEDRMLTKEFRFDYDIYKILEGYLRSPKNIRNIKQIDYISRSLAVENMELF